MGFFGLDVAAIRRLSQQLETQSREVASAERELTVLLANTDWFGADQAAFMSDWTSIHAPELRRASSLLREASSVAYHSAVRQERVSNA